MKTEDCKYGWSIMYQGFNDTYELAWFHFIDDAGLFMQSVKGKPDEMFYDMVKGHDPE